jgi:hypothetical protein
MLHSPHFLFDLETLDGIDIRNNSPAASARQLAVSVWVFVSDPLHLLMFNTPKCRPATEQSTSALTCEGGL